MEESCFDSQKGQGIFFSFGPKVHVGSGSPPPPRSISNGYRGLFREVNQLGCEAEYSRASSALFKIARSFTSAPQYAFVVSTWSSVPLPLNAKLSVV
jgi:hypothetical protein